MRFLFQSEDTAVTSRYRAYRGKQGIHGSPLLNLLIFAFPQRFANYKLL